ncbi:MAG TPA: efflux transporter outer membrane subunit [Rudaea sp.]|nr:efflux transporter outer membrane subunit [Rudaea sp.]
MTRPACILALGVALVLSGCAIGPDYERPKDLPAQEQFRSVLTPQEAASFADLPWAETFNDPELRVVLETALRNNLDLQLALARVEEARGYARVARSYLGPEIRGVGSTSPTAASREDSAYSLGLSLNWELDLFGRLRRSNEAARAQLLATEDGARGVTNSLVASVASTWFQLRELDEEVAIIERTIESQQASLSLVQSQKRNGIASATEEMQALAQLAGTRAQLPLTEQKRVQTENQLRFLTGGEPAPVDRAQSSTSFPVPDQIPVGLPAQLLARRPDLRQLEDQLHAATANVGVAQASRFPYLSIGLTSFFGIVSPEIGHLLDGKDPASNLFSVGPFVDLPIFQSGRGTGNVEVAEAQLKQAELSYRRGVLQAYRETADALIVTDKVRSVIGENSIRADAARRLLDLQHKRYRAGVVSYLEVLDAERQLFSAEIDLARARLSQVQGYIELYRALGGGWTP